MAEYENELMSEAVLLRQAIIETFGDRVEMIEEAVSASQWSGCCMTLARFRDSGDTIELWLDHSAGYKYPMYWCGISFLNENNLNIMLSHFPPERIILRKGADGYASIDGDRIAIDKIPREYIHEAVSEEYPQHGEFYLGCYFGDYTDVDAVIFIKTLLDLDFVKSSIMEGGVRQRMADFYERNQAARMRCVNAPGGLDCCVCGINFEQYYGKVGAGFIHVHHVIPLAGRGGSEETKQGELVSVCPNCHAMLHRYELKRPEDLKKILDERRQLAS